MATPVSVTPPESNVFLQEIVPFTFDGQLTLLMLWSLTRGGAAVPLQVLQYNPSSNNFVDVTSSIFDGSVPGANNPRNVSIADLNHDGNPDIVIANQGLDQSPFPGSTDTLLLSTPSGQLINASGNLPQTLAFSHDVSSGVIDHAGTKRSSSTTSITNLTPRLTILSATEMGRSSTSRPVSFPKVCKAHFRPIQALP